MPSWYSCIYQFVRDSLCQCGISWSFLLIYRYMFRSMWSSRKNHWSISIAFFKAQSFQWIFFGGQENSTVFEDVFWKNGLVPLSHSFPGICIQVCFFLGGDGEMISSWFKSPFNHRPEIKRFKGLSRRDWKQRPPTSWKPPVFRHEAPDVSPSPGPSASTRDGTSAESRGQGRMCQVGAAPSYPPFGHAIFFQSKSCPLGPAL